MAQAGYTPILLFASGTPGSTPSAGNLTSSASGAELAINYADGKLFYKDSGGTVQVIATKGGVGSATNTQVLYNSSGLVVGSANLTFNGTTLTAGGFAGPLNGTVGATTPNTGAFTTLTATKATAGDVATFTNGAASNKTAYIYSDASTVSIGDAASQGSELIAFIPGSNSIQFNTNGGLRGLFSTTGLAVTGTLSCTGALSKGSGSFRITHPLPELSETHQLVHSFIEGPQADLIYRGKVNLVNGAATVNIDEAAGMTDGTFSVLCRDVQCFTTNESDWTPVRGSVAGNVLTIEAQDNTSTASVSWMVIGERKDQHMYDTDWTDDDGRVIVEPLKPVVEVNDAEI